MTISKAALYPTQSMWHIYQPLYAYVYYMHKPNVGRRQHMDGAGGMENVYGNLF